MGLWELASVHVYGPDLELNISVERLQESSHQICGALCARPQRSQGTAASVQWSVRSLRPASGVHLPKCFIGNLTFRSLSWQHLKPHLPKQVPL